MSSTQLTNEFISTNPVAIVAPKKRQKKVIPTCQICVEPFNKSSRLPIQCPYCEYDACRTCCETYILNETVVKCMNPECAKPWTRKHIRDRFTLVFINSQLKEHTEKILFDKERALLPATQPIIEARIEGDKLQEEINKIFEQMTVMRQQAHQLQIDRLNVINRRPRGEARAFVRACPSEECRGFLSTQWKCGICEKWTCPDCHIVKGYTRDAEHTCNADDLATAKLIAADTKPCPKCGTGIFKIDGCDQMWCTQCHTPFSWRTGNIEKSVHNPHYFEWMRRTGGGEAPRNPLDVPCGRNLDHYLYESFSRTIRAKYQNTSNYRAILKRMDETIRYAVHILHIEIYTPPNYERRNENLRVSYLMNQITEEHMRDILQRDDKRHHRNQEMSDIYTLLTTTVTDILYRFLDQLQNQETTIRTIDDSILTEIDAIVEYSNECFADISHTYSCSKIIIERNLHIIRGQKAVQYIREQREQMEEDGNTKVKE